MSQAITQIFANIPKEELNTALQCGLLLGSASSIFYLFFGRLLSVPELLSNTLRNPSSSQSRNCVIVISGFVFVTAILRVFYHEHISAYFPFDDEIYLKKISTLRLIISGTLVGVGSQLALQGRQNSGVLGIPRFTLSSIVAFAVYFGSAMLTVTYKFSDILPKTPRVVELANQALPRNISFDAYLLVSLLTPFVVFLISKKKTLKGLIESIAHFVIGIMMAWFLMLIGWSSARKAISQFSYTGKWTGEMIVAYGVATFVLAFVYLIVRYGFKKPLFSNILTDKVSSLTLKALIGYVLTGVGFGLGGMIFESFLMTVPSSQIRVAVFWGLPCIFSMKAIQVLSERSELKTLEEKKQ